MSRADIFIQGLRRWAEERTDPVEGFFGPTSVTWQVNREAAIYLGGLRALLMQIAHPKVAQGVADHSNFRVDPYSRLRRTFDVVHAMVFGSREDALTAAHRLYRVHERVRGRLTDPPDGMTPTYSAGEQDLLLWVYATLVSSSLHAYATFFDPLTPSESERFYEESKTFARLAGVDPGVVPESLESFNRYVSTMIDSSQVEVTGVGQEIAESLLKGPPLLYLFRPSNYVLAAGMLPPTLREQFGLSWSLPVRAAYGFGVSLVRAVTPRLPPALRYIPSARRADRRCSARQRLAA